MTSKYFSGRKGHYIFCDICGQACYDWEVTKLSQATGRPGLLVCPGDADGIDHGLIPYTVSNEKSVHFARVNHTDVDNGATPLDIENSTSLGV